MDYNKLLQAILDIAEEMLVCGAEVSRVEESIERMCGAYGCDRRRVNAFIITSNIQVTLEDPEGHIITQIRRIVRNDTNFDRLDHLNDLSRYICRERPPLSELLRRYEAVMNRRGLPVWVEYLGALLIAGCFAVFFGGNARDGAAAALLGLLITLAMRFSGRFEENQLAKVFMTSVLAGFAALAEVGLGLGNNVDKIMIGGIMLLIPGIAMTNSLRDMLIGDLASGLLRLVNSLLLATAIACGFALPLILTGGAGGQLAGMAGMTNSMPTQVVTALLGSVGFAFFLKMKGRQAVLAGVGGAATWLIYLLCQQQIEGYFIPYFIASLFVAIYAEIMARVNRSPATIFLTAAAVPLIPGGSLYYTMAGLVNREQQLFAQSGENALTMALAIALGFVSIAILTRYITGISSQRK